MTTRAVRIVAASLFGLAAGTSLALAQSKRPWVDPPADLSTAAPVEKPAVEEPTKPTPAAAKAASEAEVARVKPEAKSAKLDVEPPKPEPGLAERQEVEAPKVKPAKPRVQAVAKPAPKPRIAQRRGPGGERPDGLIEMRMQTLQFPDGRTVTVLTPPGGAGGPILSGDGWR